MKSNRPTFDIAQGEALQAEQQRLRLRQLSDRERGELILAACRAAATIHASRIKSGLPPAVPAPWPASTWEFLRQNAPHAKRR